MKLPVKSKDRPRKFSVEEREGDRCVCHRSRGDSCLEDFVKWTFPWAFESV